MAITYEIDRWLKEEGHYEHHCFISWPLTKNPDMTECAKAVHDAIEGALGDLFRDPQVFIDTSDVRVGATWDETLRRALCRSVSMVAICSPMYYRPDHVWCGLEWAAMERLSEVRLRGQDFKTIIPLMVRSSNPLPRALSRVQYLDVSRAATQGRRYYGYAEFRGHVQEIVSRIEQIAEALWQSQSRAECELFNFPDVSAFADYAAPVQRLPLVS